MTTDNKPPKKENGDYHAVIPAEDVSDMVSALNDLVVSEMLESMTEEEKQKFIKRITENRIRSTVQRKKAELHGSDNSQKNRSDNRTLSELSPSNG